MNLKKSIYYPLSFLIFLGVFYILCNASIGNLIYPFAFSFMFALVWANQKPWIVCPSYLIASVIFNHSFAGIISAICAVFLLVVPYYIHVSLKKNIKIWELGIFAFLSQTASILFSFFQGGRFHFEIISACVGVLFMFASIFILDANFSTSSFSK